MKRLLEVKFVHIYRKNKNISKEMFIGCLIFYGGIFGFGVPLEIDNRKMKFDNFSISNIILEIFFIMFFFISEYLNFYCHMELRKLKLIYSRNKLY